MFALQKGGLENRKPEMTICLQEKDPMNYNFRGHFPSFPWLCLTTSVRGNVLVPPNSDIVHTEVFFSLCPFPWSCKISVGNIYLSRNFLLFAALHNLSASSTFSLKSDSCEYAPHFCIASTSSMEMQLPLGWNDSRCWTYCCTIV